MHATKAQVAVGVYVVLGALTVNLSSRRALALTDDKVPACAPANAQTLREDLVRARKLILSGSPEQAIPILRQIIQREPDNAEAHQLLGTALVLIPREAEGLEELQAATRLAPDSPTAWLALGEAFAKFARFQEAQPALEKTVQLDPGFGAAHVSLALVLAQGGNFSEATQHLLRAAELEKTSSAAAYPHFLLGRILTQQAKYQEALVELDTACKLKPDYGQAYLAIGVIKRKLVDDAGAVKALEKAVTALPNNVTAQQALGEEYFRQGNFAGSVEHLQRARDLAPDDRSLLYQLCQALRKAVRIPESKACEQRLLVMVHEELVLNDQTSAATAANNQGVELEKGGDLEGALAKYREAAKLNPAQTVFRRNLALALCRLGRWQEGIAELREVLKANPDDADATQALYVALDNVH